MDLKKATKEQLYEIANDEKNRLRVRYEAVKELQKRRVEDKK